MSVVLVPGQIVNFNTEAATASVFTNTINTRPEGIEGVLTYNKSWGKQSINISLAHSSIQNRFFYTE